MHALSHISYRGNRFKGLYIYKYSTSDIAFGEGNTFLSLRLGTGPRLQYFQLGRNSAIFHTIATFWSLSPHTSAGSTSDCKLRGRESEVHFRGDCS